MPRNKCYRHISSKPVAVMYKPAGIPMKGLNTITLNLDEFEALKLADEQKMYHADAAKAMQISRQTFGRIVTEARHKIATAFTHGYAIAIESNINE